MQADVWLSSIKEKRLFCTCSGSDTASAGFQDTHYMAHFSSLQSMV